jgi:hypothetical protein
MVSRYGEKGIPEDLGCGVTYISKSVINEQFQIVPYRNENETLLSRNC